MTEIKGLNPRRDLLAGRPFPERERRKKLEEEKSEAPQLLARIDQLYDVIEKHYAQLDHEARCRALHGESMDAVASKFGITVESLMQLMQRRPYERV